MKKQFIAAFIFFGTTLCPEPPQPDPRGLGVQVAVRNGEKALSDKRNQALQTLASYIRLKTKDSEKETKRKKQWAKAVKEKRQKPAHIKKIQEGLYKKACKTPRRQDSPRPPSRTFSGSSVASIVSLHPGPEDYAAIFETSEEQ